MGAAVTYQSQSINPNVYFGTVDEFRVYSRELSFADISRLRYNLSISIH